MTANRGDSGWRLLGALMAFSAGACSGTTPPAAQTAASAGTGAAVACVPPDAAPAFEPPPEPPPLVSSAAMELSVSKATLERQIGRQVPHTLASARRRPIGAPGQVTYRLVRGDLDARVDGHELVVTAPLRAEVEVCKPFGSFCPVYGRCRPELLAAVRVPLALDERLQPGKSRVTVDVTRGCVLSPIGVDVTPELRRIVRRERATISRRIDAALPRVGPELEAVWKLLRAPLALDDATCLHMRPEALAHSPPRLADGRLTLVAALRGRLYGAPCSDQEPAKPNPPPRLEASEDLKPGLHLQVKLPLDHREVEGALMAGLGSAPVQLAPTVRVTAVEVQGTRDGGQAVLAVGLRLQGAECGGWWAFAEVVPDGDALRLSSPRAAPGGSALPEDTVEALLRHLEEHGRLPLPVNLDAAGRRLDAAVRRLTAAAPEPLVAAVELAPPAVDGALTTRDAVIAVIAVRGRLSLRLP